MDIIQLNWPNFSSDTHKIEGLDLNNICAIEFRIDDAWPNVSDSVVELNKDWELLKRILTNMDKISHALFVVGKTTKAKKIENIQQNNLLIEKIAKLLSDRFIVKLGMIIHRPIKTFELSKSFSKVSMLLVAYNGTELLLASELKNQIKELALFKCRNLRQAHIEHLLKNYSNELILQLYTVDIETFKSVYLGSVQLTLDFTSLQIYYANVITYKRDRKTAILRAIDVSLIFDLFLSEHGHSDLIKVIINELHLKFTREDNLCKLPRLVKALESTLSKVEINTIDAHAMVIVFTSINSSIVQKSAGKNIINGDKVAMASNKGALNDGVHNTHHDTDVIKAGIQPDLDTPNLTVMIRNNNSNYISISEKGIFVKVGKLDRSEINLIAQELSNADTIHVLKIQDEKQMIFYDLQEILQNKPNVLTEMNELVVYHALTKINFKALFRKKRSLERFSFMGDKEIKININSIGGRRASCKYAIDTSSGKTNNMILCTPKLSGLFPAKSCE